MDNVGSEIGNKMRSAVKAKLLELGTGDSAGYIDDELPDYIMIMIANKRSKQQMVVDLNLFLGSKTDLFVTWLHEVLQKLQEVTIPTAVANSNKRTRTTSKTEKEKKEKRLKDKKNKDSIKKTNKKPTSTVGSINDVFAGHLLEKAKKDLDITAEHEHHVKKGKEVKSTLSAAKTHNECDIPTISEISSTTDGSNAREKDLAELAEIQRKIYAAKKHLKQTGEVDVHLESEDEDFLNLKDDDSTQGFDDAMLRKSTTISPAQQKDTSKDYNENVNAVIPTTSSTTAIPATPTISNKRPEKSPILFEENTIPQNDTTIAPQKQREYKRNDEREKEVHTTVAQSPPDFKSFKSAHNEAIAHTNTKEIYTKRDAETDHDMQRGRKREHHETAPPVVEQSNKRSIHQRLGLRNKSIDDRERNRQTELEGSRVNRRQRQEKELYVPAFRRRGGESESNEPRERERGRERIREPGRSRERSRERERERETRQRPSFVRRPAVNEKRRSLSSDSGHSTYEKPVETQRHRIGSRVIVAPVKPELPSESEEEIEKLNSVIKIKPRAPVSPRKQAPKNLLLRAVAEAQRSTILAKNTHIEVTKPTKRLSERLGEKTKRDGLKRSASSTVGNDNGGAALFKRTTRNLMFDVVRQKRTRYNSNEQRSHPDLNEVGEQNEEEEYVPMVVSGESDADGLYVPKSIRNQRKQHIDSDDYEERPTSTKTQFVVTLNDDKAMPKYRTRKHSRSSSPQPQVSSSSSATNAAKRDRYRDPVQRQSIKSRLSVKASASSSSVSPRVAARLGERDSNNSTPVSMSPTHSSSINNSTRRSERVEVYRKPKDVKKIIIQNDSEDDDLSPKKVSPQEQQRRRFLSDEEEEQAAKMEALRGLQQHQNGESRKRKRTPVNFSQNEKESHSRDEGPSAAKRRSRSRERAEHERERQHERESSIEAGRKISIRNAEARKYDNIPALSSVALDSAAIKVIKPKERCKYHPNCTKQFCEYYHPTASCKAFPNCKYGDKCMYSHPNCKYDLACTNADCNFAHSGPRNPNQLQTTAPPLSSHVVPVQNYKSISAATVTTAPAVAIPSSMCKYFPNCTKVSCTFLHPKMCRFGKNCINPGCNYYHHDAPSSSKFKWVATVV